jgi:hypothetical protein
MMAQPFSFFSGSTPAETGCADRTPVSGNAGTSFLIFDQLSQSMIGWELCYKLYTHSINFSPLDVCPDEFSIEI